MNTTSRLFAAVFGIVYAIDGQSGAHLSSAIDGVANVDFSQPALYSTQDEKVVISQLRGIIFHRRAEAVVTDGISLDSSVDYSQIPQLKELELEKHLADAFGKPASRESLRRITLTIRTLLTKQQKPFSLVYLPPQDVTNGFIQLVVSESVVGGVVIEDNQYFATEEYSKWITAKSGQSLDLASAQADARWISRNPYRNAAITVRAGKEPATTDLVVRVKDIKPWRATLNTDNTGNESTGQERTSLGLSGANLWGKSHQAGLRFTSDYDVHRSRNLYGYYTIDLPWRHSATLFASASKSVSEVDEPFDQGGEGRQAGMNYLVPLSGNDTLELGIDYKRNDNSLLLALGIIDIPVVSSETEVFQLRAAYRPVLTDKYGNTSLGIKLTYSPGDLSNKNSDESFQESRSNAESGYIYANLNANRSFPIAKGWDWRVRLEYQHAWQNLIGSEQFSAGGVNSARGYEQGEAFGDKGLLASHELHMPAWTTSRQRLRFYLFQDYAKVNSYEKLLGEKPNRFHSLGLGLNYSLLNALSVGLSYGWQLKDSGSSVFGDDGRLHFRLSLAY